MQAPVVRTLGSEEWNRRRSGPSGELRCGHRAAARFGAWDIAPQGIVGQADPEERWSLVGEVVERDTFWLAFGTGHELVLLDAFGLALRFRDVRRIFDDGKIGVWGAGPPEVEG